MHSEHTNQCVRYLQSGLMIVQKGLTKGLKLNSANRVATSDGSALSDSEKKHLNELPFLNYAVLNWPNHARMGDATYTDYSSSFFAQKSEIRDVWWETHWLSTKSRGAWRLTVPHNFSPLHVAAYFGIVPLALKIESKGSLWNAMQARDSHSMAPIDCAIHKAQPQMASFLLDRGTLNISKISSIPLETEPFQDAIVTGEIETVTYLLKRSGNPEQLLSAAKWTTSDVIKSSLLAAKYWEAVVNQVAERVHWSDWRRLGHGGGNETPLHISAAYGNLDVCKVLIQYGADANSETDTQWKPIHNAAWYGFPEVIKLLISHGADPKAQSNDFYTPLHCAVHEAHTECVRLLLKYDVILDLKNSKGREPLHTASKSDNVAIVELLLDAGANVNALCKAGGTPLFYAASNGKNETLEYLLDHGADTEIKKPSTEENSEPVSVFDVAKTKGHKTTLAILNAHIQGERVPRKRSTFSTELSQPDQPTTITGAHATQIPENEVAMSPLSTASETADRLGLKISSTTSFGAIGAAGLCSSLSTSI